jgi:ribonuclease Z
MRRALVAGVIPPLPIDALDGPFLGRSRQIFHGPIRVGHDGDFLTLPAGTHDIRRSNRPKMLF